MANTNSLEETLKATLTDLRRAITQLDFALMEAGDGPDYGKELNRIAENIFKISVDTVKTTAKINDAITDDSNITKGKMI